MPILALTPLIIPFVVSTTVRVPNDYPKIMDAIAAVSDGDTVRVAPGIYRERIDPEGKALYLVGAGAELTALQGPGGAVPPRGGVLRFLNGEGRGTIVEGFTIQDGVAQVGGGVFFDQGTSPELRRCTIAGNRSLSRGGAIFALGAAPRIFDCTVRENSSDGGGGGLYYTNGATGEIDFCRIRDNRAALDGGGLRLDGSAPRVVDCIISENQAGDDGGGAYIFSDSEARFERCLFRNNVAADDGGGLKIYFASPTISECAILDNSSQENGGGIYFESTSGILERTLVANNATSAQGAGICCDESADPIITACEVRENRSGSAGGGIGCDRGAVPLIRNCILVENHAEEWGGGLSAGNGSYPRFEQMLVGKNTAGAGGAALACAEESRMDLINSIIWAQKSPRFTCDPLSALSLTYCDVQGGWEGVGNLNIPPSLMTWERYNWVLSPGSVCIDAGSPAAEDGLPWPPGYNNTARSDIGPYGGPYATTWLPETQRRSSVLPSWPRSP